MKKTFYKAILAIASLALASITPAKAVTYAEGDLLLGFRAADGTGATQDYVVNIGPASNYTGGTGSFIVNGLGNTGADLTAIFGADWSSRADVFAGIAGTARPADPANTLYASRARVSVDTPATAWIGRSPSGQGVTTSKIQGLAGSFINGNATTNSPVGTIQNVADINSYASYQPGGTPANSGGVSFAAFNPSVEANFTGGAGAVVLDLFRIEPIFDQPGTLVGSFTIDGSGVIVFTKTGATALATIRLDKTTYSASETAGQIAVKVLRGNGLGAATATLTTTNGTAVAGTDFTAPTTLVSFAIGETEKIVSIPVISRPGVQGNRSFSLALSAPTGGVLVTPTSATVTITESEQSNTGVIAFTDATYSQPALTSGGIPNLIPVTLTRTGGTTGAVTVAVAVTGGTLVAGSDFETPGTVTFANGENSQTVSIQLNAISPASLPGTIALSLTNPTNGASIGALGTATVEVTAAILAPVKGTYTGFFNPAPGSGLPQGFITIKVLSNGTFTGKVTVAGVRKSVMGRVDDDGVLRFSPTNATSIALTAGTLELQLNGQSLSGSVKNSSGALLASVAADRAFFDGKTSATTVPGALLANKGKYTIVFPARATQSGLTASQYPQGDGYAFAKLDFKGVLTITGKLADGTVLSTSAKLAQDLSFNLFAQLYGKGGAVSGEAQFVSTPDSDLQGTGLQWTRPAGAGSVYASGWPGGILLDVIGSTYAKPKGTVILPGLKPVEAAAGNATLEFTAGGLTAPVTKAVNIGTDNKVVSAPAGDASFKAKFDTKKAGLKGKFTHTNGQETKFQGIVFQKGANAGAYGYFLSSESGSVTLTPKP